MREALSLAEIMVGVLAITGKKGARSKTRTLQRKISGVVMAKAKKLMLKRKSRRSVLKTVKQIKQNQEVLNKLK